ncbi:MAG: response regulator [Phycisphaerae bacterium]|nr:response regulator [Phycisphaerae bacterium]
MADTTRRIPDKTILIVEDEADLAELLRINLEREGYACRVAGAGDQALAEARRQAPSLVLLDRMLPGLSGDEVASLMRRDPATANIPIIMLTAKVEESDELVGFALGADDYVTKPFSMKVLLARVRSIFRRTLLMETDLDTLRIGPFQLTPSRHELTVDGQPVQLTATEFRLLKALMVARGRVRNRDQLIDTAFGVGVAITDRTVDVHVTALRKKLGACAGWIQTVRGVGYTFREPQEPNAVSP